MVGMESSFRVVQMNCCQAVGWAVPTISPLNGDKSPIKSSISIPNRDLDPALFTLYTNLRISLVIRKSEVDRQREHQANERTFLAWLRTSIALIGFGFAIARFGLFLHQLQATVTQQAASTNSLFSSENLGVSLVIVGIVVIALAAWRYNQVFWQIERGDYRPNRLMVWLIAGVVMILGTLSIPLVLWRNQEPSPPSSAPSKQQSQNPRLFLSVWGVKHGKFRPGTRSAESRLICQKKIETKLLDGSYAFPPFPRELPFSLAPSLHTHPIWFRTCADLDKSIPARQACHS